MQTSRQGSLIFLSEAIMQASQPETIVVHVGRLCVVEESGVFGSVWPRSRLLPCSLKEATDLTPFSPS